MASVSKQEDFQGMYKVKKRFRLAFKQVPAFFPRLFWLFAAICQKKVCRYKLESYFWNLSVCMMWKYLMLDAEWKFEQEVRKTKQKIKFIL